MGGIGRLDGTKDALCEWDQCYGTIWSLRFISNKIMSHTAKLPWATIPKDVEAKITAYGDAIVSSWVPQQQLLDHAVRIHDSGD